MFDEDEGKSTSRNYYRCASCGFEWTDVWSCQCDDDCPQCGARHMSPYKSEDQEELRGGSDTASESDERLNPGWSG
jgi:predicted  nucleic acid-binding Zn-ribbon protein